MNRRGFTGVKRSQLRRKVIRFTRITRCTSRLSKRSKKFNERKLRSSTHFWNNKSYCSIKQMEWRSRVEELLSHSARANTRQYIRTKEERQLRKWTTLSWSTIVCWRKIKAWSVRLRAFTSRSRAVVQVWAIETIWPTWVVSKTYLPNGSQMRLTKWGSRLSILCKW